MKKARYRLYRFVHETGQKVDSYSAWIIAGERKRLYSEDEKATLNAEIAKPGQRRWTQDQVNVARL